MAKIALAWGMAVTALTSLTAVVAFRASAQQESGRLSSQVVSPAASVNRPQQGRPEVGPGWLASVERRFEEDSPGQGPDVARRQQALEGAIREAITTLDADVHSAECRASACRVDVTFDSGRTSHAFLERAFLRTDEKGDEIFEHGGVYSPVQEPAGARHHSVFYVLKKPTAG